MQAHAEFSTCRNYRYALWRTWDDDLDKVLFIGLNPATADENKDDNTIKRCMSYAGQWGFGGVVVGNLFAYRTPSPKELMRQKDPVGVANDAWLKKLSVHASMVLAIWGNDGSFLDRDSKVVQLFSNLMCLRITIAGRPHHTRGLPDGIKPIPYPYKNLLVK